MEVTLTVESTQWLLSDPTNWEVLTERRRLKLDMGRECDRSHTYKRDDIILSPLVVEDLKRQK